MLILYTIMAKQIKKIQTLTELLKEALAQAPSLRGVERETGVKHPSLIRFLRGEQSLRLDMADRLAEHFGIVSKQEKK